MVEVTEHMVPFVRHKMQKGQTLYGLGRAYGIDPEHILAFNAYDDPSVIPLGAELKLPLGLSILGNDVPNQPGQGMIPAVYQVKKRQNQSASALLSMLGTNKHSWEQML